MKKYTIVTNKEKTAIEVKVYTKNPQLIAFKVENFNKLWTVYIDTFVKVDGSYTGLLNLPQSGDVVLLSIYNKNNPHIDNFTVTSLKRVPLKTSMLMNFKQESTKNYIKFAQEFCENAGILSAGGSIYESNDGEFKVKYSDVIRDSKTNQMINTPARINTVTKVMELSKPKFREMTVAGRFGVMTHEYAHVFENVDKNDEIEADTNSLKIFLGLGYPKIEAYNTWLKVFTKNPSRANTERYKSLDKIISEY